MALVLKDRVKETCSSPGLGTVTLLGAVTEYQSFSAIGNGNTTYYTIADQNGANWEVGIGTYTASGTTLSRDTVLASSASGAKVNFSSGTQAVWCDYPAGKAAYANASGQLHVDGQSYINFESAPGTAVAAGMPLFVGVSAIAGALFGVWAVSLFTDVSVFALNLITGLGLGLGPLPRLGMAGAAAAIALFLLAGGVATAGWLALRWGGQLVGKGNTAAAEF